MSEVFDPLIFDSDATQRMLFASVYVLNRTEQRYLAHDPSALVRKKLAQRTTLFEDIQQILAVDPFLAVRIELANTLTTIMPRNMRSRQALLILAEDPEFASWNRQQIQVVLNGTA